MGGVCNTVSDKVGGIFKKVSEYILRHMHSYMYKFVSLVFEREDGISKIMSDSVVGVCQTTHHLVGRDEPDLLVLFVLVRDQMTKPFSS